MDLWERLGKPQLIVAPMVDASELPWRLLSRAHGAQLCYSPMFHSAVFTKDFRYRKEALASTEKDRPLIIQFCGNEPEVILNAAKLAEPYCDAIDVNLGCPQGIAKRGNYGAFLQDNWDLVGNIVYTLAQGLSIPVTCKIRVFESIEKTIKYAKMLENSGCKMLTVHGRTRDQKGPLTGIASWEHIRAVRENVKIPILANGNIQCLSDVEKCLKTTNCNGVMSAEGNLYNPFIFEGVYPPSWEPALEYLNLVLDYPCPLSYTRGHLFKLCHSLLSLKENEDIREDIAKGQEVTDFINALTRLKERFLPYHEGKKRWPQENSSYDLVLPPWLCQPYIRLAPEKHLKKIEDKKVELLKENLKRKREAEPEMTISKKKLKKLKRGLKISENPHCRREVPICHLCPNPMGLKCDYFLCKTCCRNKCYADEEDCPGHGILIKTRRANARQRAKENENR